MFPGHLLQAAKITPSGRWTWQSPAIKSIVHHKIKSSAHIGNIALEHFIRVHRNFQPVQVQAIIRLKELADIRIFVFLLLTGGKAQALKVSKSNGTRRISTSALCRHIIASVWEKRSMYCCSTLMFSDYEFIIHLLLSLSNRSHVFQSPSPIPVHRSLRYVHPAVHVPYRV